MRDLAPPWIPVQVDEEKRSNKHNNRKMVDSRWRLATAV